jgi:hypothetical protein
LRSISIAAEKEGPEDFLGFLRKSKFQSKDEGPGQFEEVTRVVGYKVRRLEERREGRK